MNATQFAMLNGWEIVLIMAVVLVLFGAKKLPELARGLGKGIKEFKKATRDVTDELQSAMDEPPPPPTRRIPEQSTDTTATANAAQTVAHSTPEAQASLFVRSVRSWRKSRKNCPNTPGRKRAAQ